jgi:hypothetical protein
VQVCSGSITIPKFPSLALLQGVTALIHMTAMLLFYSLHKYYIIKITYFSKAYNHASFEDLKVRGTILTSLLFYHVVITDCRKLN